MEEGGNGSVRKRTGKTVGVRGGTTKKRAGVQLKKKKKKRRSEQSNRRKEGCISVPDSAGEKYKKLRPCVDDRKEKNTARLLRAEGRKRKALMEESRGGQGRRLKKRERLRARSRYATERGCNLWVGGWWGG